MRTAQHVKRVPWGEVGFMQLLCTLVAWQYSSEFLSETPAYTKSALGSVPSMKGHWCRHYMHTLHGEMTACAPTLKAVRPREHTREHMREHMTKRMRDYAQSAKSKTMRRTLLCPAPDAVGDSHPVALNQVSVPVPSASLHPTTEGTPERTMFAEYCLYTCCFLLSA